MAQSDSDPRFPEGPIDKLVGPLERFLHVEAASGIVLLAATVAALVLANSAVADGFLGIWQTKLTIAIGSIEMSHSLKHWINDGLMVVFFFVVGLEVKRELMLGELREPRAAVLPIAAAIGGMVVPAGIYLALQAGEPAQRGWGIPMATDIAFVVGCMAVLGRRIPGPLRVLLLSLAIADDIGAILVIAIAYTESLDWTALLIGIAGIGLVRVCHLVGIRSLLIYTLLGVAVWVAFHESGVHATIAGVILGLMTPTRTHVGEGMFARVLSSASDVFHGGDWKGEVQRAQKLRDFRRMARETVSPLEYLETTLHPWVSFLIMPLFALSNAGVPLRLADFGEPVAVAVMAGLFVGKPLGIVAMSWLAVRSGLARLPEGLPWLGVVGGGFLAGIGFTMSMFIASLALRGGAHLDTAKVGVLAGSALSAALGIVILLRLPRPAST